MLVRGSTARENRAGNRALEKLTPARSRLVSHSVRTQVHSCLPLGATSLSLRQTAFLFQTQLSSDLNKAAKSFLQSVISPRKSFRREASEEMSTFPFLVRTRQGYRWREHHAWCPHISAHRAERPRGEPKESPWHPSHSRTCTD